MLSAINRASGWWTSAIVSTIQRQQRETAKMIVKTWKLPRKKRRRK